MKYIKTKVEDSQACSCGCGKEHKKENAIHDHSSECGCGHNHASEKAEGSCCEKVTAHEHKEGCACGHKEEEESSCCENSDREHKHEKDCSCNHETENKHSETCGCSSKTHEHSEACGCSSKTHVHSEDGSCCGGGGSHKHDASCGCGIDHKAEDNKKSLITLIISAIFLVIGFFRPYNIFGYELFVHLDPSIVAVVLCGIPIFKGAYKAVFKDKTIRASVLIALAILASVALEIMDLTGLIAEDGHGHSGFLFAAGEIAVLMMLGQILESYTVGKSKKGIEDLVKLAPKMANLMVNGEIVLTAVENLKVGDVVLIKPNEMISVDGIVLKGKTAIDQSSMTGESLPVDKGEGDEVFGGTWNKEGVLEVRVTKLQKDMAVSKLISLVEEASGRKAPIALLADKWAKYIVPAALIISFAVSLFSAFVSNLGWLESVVRGVTILVVFCPCALTLATPTAIAAGIGNISKRGILVKSGGAIETLAKVDVVCFDKTGTLTKGELAVKDVYAENGNVEELMTFAKSVESYSEHPIAKAVLNAEKGKIIPPTDTKSIVGVGIEAVVEERKVLVCKHSELERLNIKEKNDSFPQEQMKKGNTVVAVVVENEVHGYIALSDTLKEGVKETISKLNAMGIETVMLTGDNQLVANEVAKEIGIKKVYGELMPEMKLEIIERLKAEGKTTLMVGDGVNDAPSLATADTSIAMAELGSDVAIETADSSILNSDIRKLPSYLAFSKKTLRRIKANIIFSIFFNIVATILGSMGILNPVTGALMHNVSSIFVVVSSTLLLTSNGVWKK